MENKPERCGYKINTDTVYEVQTSRFSVNLHTAAVDLKPEKVITTIDCSNCNLRKTFEKVVRDLQSRRDAESSLSQLASQFRRMNCPLTTHGSPYTLNSKI